MLARTESRLSALLDIKYREFFVPTILMAMTLTMSIVVDSIIVGNMLGSDALAAVNLVMPVIMVYNTVAVCLGLGAATLISVAKGRRDPDHANAVFTTVLLSLVAAGALLLTVQLVMLDPIARLLTGEPTLQPLVRSYLHVLACGTPLIVAVPGLAYCLRVDARVKLASTVLIVSNLVNLALDLVYMGPLDMGIAGSSLATVSGYVIGALCLLPYALGQGRTLRIAPALLADIPQLKRHLGSMVKTGFPAAMGSILITFKILCVNHIVLAVAGKSGMVAFAVCLSCLSFVSMFISGAAQAMTPIVGVLYGEKDYGGIRFVVRRAFITLMVASLAATLLLEAFPAQILALFGVHEAADIAEGIPAIRIFSLSLMGTSVTFLSMYYYMTTGHTALSTAISITQGTLVVPVALILSRVMGTSGVWLAFSVAEIATVLMIAACYATLRKKYPCRYASPLLLDQDKLPQAHRLETTVRDTHGGLAEMERRVREFADALRLAPDALEPVLRTVRDAVGSILSHAPGRPGHVDIRLEVHDHGIVVALRDNVPGHALNRDGEPGRSLAQACHVQHSQAIGFNNHVLTFGKA